MANDPSLLLLEPGLQTTIQDLGRPGFMRVGVAPGGALDRAALILGNRLVGNDPGAAALEITLLGPRLRFSADAVVAITGADLGPTLDGAALPLWRPIGVRSGAELAFAPSAGGGAGSRCYLCVAGGVAVEPVMGSRSTDLAARFGGWHGRALRAGEELPFGSPRAEADELLRRRLASAPPTYDAERPIRAVLGPQSDRFTAAGLATFLDETYSVSPRSDRMGLRLEGAPVAHGSGADLISEGIAHGAVQVPGDGRPIVLLAARQTVGGYPKIATVIAADLDALGQRGPGDPVRFATVDVAGARRLALAYHAALGEDAVVTTAPGGLGWAPEPEGHGEVGGDVADAWTPEAVARLANALRAAEVSAFRLHLAGAGLTLDLTWGSPSSFMPAPHRPDDATLLQSSVDDENMVKAPLLGVFFRRPTPDQPPFTDEGQEIAAGQTIGLIEVMKTYHEVTAPHAGTLAAFLVEDGTSVEYGQPIARLDPIDRPGS